MNATTDPQTTECVTGIHATYWHLGGKYHREGDLPAITLPDGRQEWRRHGLLHRTTGPAIIDPHKGYDWWVNGLHVWDPDKLLENADPRAVVAVLELTPAKVTADLLQAVTAALT